MLHSGYLDDRLTRPSLQVSKEHDLVFLRTPPITDSHYDRGGEPYFIYVIQTGELHYEGELFAVGYSGRAGIARNSPHAVADRGKGPIPPGFFRLVRIRSSQRTGRYVIDLEQTAGESYGRSAFQIHGDNAKSDASSGCIVLGLADRLAIWRSGIRLLKVVPR